MDRSQLKAQCEYSMYMDTERFLDWVCDLSELSEMFHDQESLLAAVGRQLLTTQEAYGNAAQHVIDQNDAIERLVKENQQLEDEVNRLRLKCGESQNVQLPSFLVRG